MIEGREEYCHMHRKAGARAGSLLKRKHRKSRK
jgi:hypothetical protein